MYRGSPPNYINYIFHSKQIEIIFEPMVVNQAVFFSANGSKATIEIPPIKVRGLVKSN